MIEKVGVFIQGVLANNRHFIKKTASVLTGSVIVQLIPIFVLPFLARSIEQEILGYYLLWISFSSLFAILMTMKLDVAMFVSQTKGDALKLLQLISILSIVIGGLLFLLGQCVLLFIDVGPEYLILKPFFLLLILYSIIFSVITGINSFQVYCGDFFNYNISRIVFALVLNASVLLTVLLLSNSLEAVIYSHVIGSMVSLLIIFYQNGLYKKQINVKWLIKEATMLLNKHKNFLRFSMPAEFISNLSNQIPLILIASKYGGTYLAYYALINKSLSAPIGLIASSFLAVFKDEASTEFRENNNCKKSYVKVLKTLSFVAIFCFGILFLILPELFSIFFGSTYKEAGSLARLLVPLFLIRFIASPLSYTLFITENQVVDFLWQLALLIVVFLIFYLSSTFNMSIVLFSSAYTMMYVLNLILSHRAAMNKL